MAHKEFAPDPIYGIYTEVKRLAPELKPVFLGITGNKAHTDGYHRAPFQLPASDYSLQLRDDKMGDDDADSALDIGFGPDGMKIVTNRLIKATRARDPRILTCLREFFGTVDGKHVTGLDVRGNYWVTSDDSHLWHLHQSIIRRYAINAEALSGIASVIAGKPGPHPPTPDDGDVMTNYAAQSTAKPQKIPTKNWVTLKNADAGYVTLVAGAVRGQSQIQLTATGVKQGGALHLRFYVSDSKTGQPDKRIASYPIYELIGTTGASAGQASQFYDIGKPPAGLSRRLRVEAIAETEGVTVTAVVTRSFYDNK